MEERFSAHGRDWKLELVSRGRLSRFALTTSTPPLPSVELNLRRRPFWRDWIASRGGHAVGDARFRRAVKIDSELPERTVRTLLAAPATREAVRVIYRLGMKNVWFKGHELTVSVFDASPELIEPDRVRALAAAVATLLDTLPALPPELAIAPQYSKRRVSIAVGSVIAPTLLGLGSLYIAAPRWLTVSRTPVVLAVLAGVIIGLVADPLRRWLARPLGNAREPYQAMVWAIGFACLAASGFLALNAVGDGSPVVEHPTRVIDTTYGRGVHHAKVESWRPDGGAVWILISYREWARLKPGDPVVARTRSGRWGCEWVVHE